MANSVMISEDNRNTNPLGKYAFLQPTIDIDSIMFLVDRIIKAIITKRMVIVIIR